MKNSEDLKTQGFLGMVTMIFADFTYFLEKSGKATEEELEKLTQWVKEYYEELEKRAKKI